MATGSPKYLTPAVLTTGGVLLVAALAGSAFRKPKPRWNLSGKTVVITGGSRGLGLSLAEEFALSNARLVIAARDSHELKRAKELLLAKRPSIRAENLHPIACDLMQPDECKRLIEEASRHFGQVDVLINNAGLMYVGPIEQQPLKAYRDAMELNYFAMVQTVHAVLPQMIERKEGKIINIASIGGKIPVPHMAPYVGSKFAAVGFSETLHAEVRGKGIHVTTVCPGLMRTGSYPNALMVGNRQKEYRWFSLSASIPGVAHSAEAAAQKILEAMGEGRSEITVGWDAYLAARLHGLVPDLTQRLGSLANELILPASGGSTQPASGQTIKPPLSNLWRSLSNLLTRTHNQPSA